MLCLIELYVYTIILNYYDGVIMFYKDYDVLIE